MGRYDVLYNTRHRLEALLGNDEEIVYAHAQKRKWSEIADYMSLVMKRGGTKQYDDDTEIKVPKFERSETGCTVYARGLTPTYPAAGAPLAFVTNGTVSIRRNYAVLGVDIDTPQRTAGALNVLSPSFGVPITVCTNVSRAAGLDLSDVQTAGNSPEPIRSAGLGRLGRGGDVLSDVGIDGVSSGFVLLEASDAVYSDAVELVVEANGKELYKFTTPVAFYDVDSMYRWRNIRSVTGGTFLDTATQEWTDGPIGRPDGECDGTHVVFLHGYNVNEREARAWARAVFKRLWWAGMASAFTAVAWHGDDGQTTLGYNVITPDYQRNVEHAFASASNLAMTVNSLLGRKFMMAHSLGNMVVSAARQDHGLQYEKYFMVNAAVPVEAYDPVNGVTPLSKAGMTNPEWVGYPDRVRASHWWELFPAGDGRRLLTWKGRFLNVTDTLNYYSSEDEVLVDGDGTLPNFPRRNHAALRIPLLTSFDYSRQSLAHCPTY